MQQLVQLYNGGIKTTSLMIAQVFEKDHRNVLRDIREIEQKCKPEFTALNFERSTYKGKNGENAMYFIGRDGFAMLAMGFNGDRAFKFKEDYIEAFNKMEVYIRQQEPKTPIFLPTYSQRLLSRPTRDCPDNKWCIFDVANEVMLFIEKHIGSVNHFDLVDGSMGIHWMKQREGKAWKGQVGQFWYHHEDVRGDRMANCFDYKEMEHCKIWLREVYMKKHLADYLFNKYKNDKFMLPRVVKFAVTHLGIKAPEKKNKKLPPSDENGKVA